MSTVEFNRASKYYQDGTCALKELSISLHEGELLVLVGPSGCGKSTSLRMLAGLESISDGEILVDGHVVNDFSPQKRNIAMVFQNYALYPHWNVEKNILFPLRMMKLNKSEMGSRLANVVRMLSLEELVHRKPSQLSGGQLQRVAMGRAIIRNPKVLLMDEPLSNLDAKMRVQLRTEIAKLQEKLRSTMFYVTHDQVEAMTLGHRVAVLNNGLLQQIDTPKNIYRHPVNTFVANFIGSPGMNIFPARLSQGNAGPHVTVGDQSISLDNLSAVQLDKLAAYYDQNMYIGLRPESFTIAESDGIQVQVTALESLGHEYLVYFGLQNVDGSQYVARLPGEMAFFDALNLVFDDRHMYFFDGHGLSILGPESI